MADVRELIRFPVTKSFILWKDLLLKHLVFYVYLFTNILFAHLYLVVLTYVSEQIEDNCFIDQWKL